MNQRGFTQLPIAAWGAIGAAAVILGLGAYGWVQTARLDACNAKFSAFQAQVKALGDVAAAKAKAENDRQAKLLKESEAQSAKLKSDLSIANKRLRDERASSSRVPEAPAGSPKPHLACFDRSELESALQRLDEGVSGFLDEGDQNTLRLKLSRDWAMEALR